MTDTELMKFFEHHYREQVRFDKHMGMELTVKSPGEVSYCLKVGEQHLTAPDSAHGGVAAAMMDATLGVAALSYAVTQGNLCATVEFKINYLRQARPGTTLVSSGKVKNIGKRLVVSRADIVEEETGDLIATGLGTFTQYPAGRRKDVQHMADAQVSFSEDEIS
ncbi:MAG: PaaI family thioesterase [Proteobacteria bacterium]|nr:PaaI family thioesterase [Pseudomonadota bacterium]MBU1386456.1 PaaI family thioesterase [Pseudomonadota bacterium]MBU1544567.1 PaaI family thioesterase [Pseudomonadota bacterium]MBU2431791.1 PaaI family thioesterase [Pseudomonadota bacterium]MBU2481222.1 PaaI family thioesterase [Pseudomonadota bacterium]